MAGFAGQLEPGRGPQAGLGEGEGTLGVWATGCMSNLTEMGGGRLWEEEGYRGFGHAGVGRLGGIFRDLAWL